MIIDIECIFICFFVFCCEYEQEIDTVRERFRCQFWISFSWLPTFYEWLDYKDHQLNNNLSEWRPSWIPIVTFPELIHQWKLHFAEKPSTGKFCIGLLHGKEEDIGYDPKFCKFIRCKLECDLVCCVFYILLPLHHKPFWLLWTLIIIKNTDIFHRFFIG